MNRDDERLAQLHATLVDQVHGLVTGDDWQTFLTQARKFHRYSAHNQCLLAAQLAERGVDPASGGLVASYKTWTRIPADGGGTCQVRKGAKALWVWAPLLATRREVDDDTGQEHVVSAGVRGYKAVPVFHQTQLDRPPAVVDPPLPQLLTGDAAPQRVWAAIVAELTADGYAVEQTARRPGVSWNGQTDFAARTVTVHDDLEPPQRLKTLAHEWGHVALDHADSVVGPRRQVAEVEAESVAYLVCATVGIDAAQYTIPYVSGWAHGDVELVKATAERVLATTARLLGRLEDRLHIDLNPDPLRPLEPEASVTQLHPPTGSPPVTPDLDPVADQPAGRLDLDRARRRLAQDDATELSEPSAAERVAMLLAAAGAEVTDAVATMQQLGVPDGDIHDALTAVVPYDNLDRAAEPLYDPVEVTRAIGTIHLATPAPEHTVIAPVTTGHALIEQWSQLGQQAPVPVRALQPPLA